MTRRSRRNHSPALKAKVALAVIRGEQTLVELYQQFDVHANQIKQWKDHLLGGATDVFDDEDKIEPTAPTVDVKTLHAKIGELALENIFSRSARQGGITRGAFGTDRCLIAPKVYRGRLTNIDKKSIKAAQAATTEATRITARKS